jgi:hypothetical protein
MLLKDLMQHRARKHMPHGQAPCLTPDESAAGGVATSRFGIDRITLMSRGQNGLPIKLGLNLLLL